MTAVTNLKICTFPEFRVFPKTPKDRVWAQETVLGILSQCYALEIRSEALWCSRRRPGDGPSWDVCWSFRDIVPPVLYNIFFNQSEIFPHIHQEERQWSGPLDVLRLRRTLCWQVKCHLFFSRNHRAILDATCSWRWSLRRFFMLLLDYFSYGSLVFLSLVLAPAIRIYMFRLH